MELNDIIKRLYDCPITVFSKANFSTEITGIRLIAKHQIKFQPNLLYFGKASQLPASPPESMLLNFLCYGETSLPGNYRKNEWINLLMLNLDTDECEIFNRIQEMFQESSNVIVGMRQLLDSLYSDLGLQNMADVAYKVFGNPVFIVDTSYKYLAFSSGIIPDSKLMEEENKNKRIADEGIDMIKKMQVDDKVRKNGRPVFIKNPVLNKCSLIDAVTIHKIEVAHVMLYELNKPFCDEDYELLHRLSILISLELQKNSFYKNNRGVMCSYFLADLLDNNTNMNNLQSIKHRLELLGYKLKNYLYVFTISSHDYPATEEQLENITEQLHWLITGSIYVIYNNNIVLLISRSEKKGISDYERSDLKKYLENNHIAAGMSNCFTDIREIKNYYHQSLKAAEAGRRHNEAYGVYNYEDIAIYHMLELCSSKEDLWNFCDPAIITLINFDKVNKTELSKTLYHYLECSQSSILSAQKLYIHKNTLLYRVNKIKSLINNPLTDGEYIMRLMLSYKILNYLNVKL